MRAVVITRPGGPEVLELRDVRPPEAGPGEILVRVAAVGLNRADLLQRKGHYPAPEGVPADIPGLEYAGEVAALGGGVKRWCVGDRVMGLVAGGAYAERLVTRADTALPVPDGWRWPEAAAVPEVFLTAYDALVRQMRLAAGESVLVHAVSSGVGTAAVQLVKAWGARCLGTSRSADKLARALPLGLDVAIDTLRDDVAEVVKRETGGRGVDVVLDLVGGPVFEASVKALAHGGRMIVVGLTGGRSAPLDLGALLNKRLTIVGTTLRSRPAGEKAALARDFEREVLPLFSAARLRPVLDRTFPMAEVAEGHRVMEANAHFGKLVLVW